MVLGRSERPKEAEPGEVGNNRRIVMKVNPEARDIASSGILENLARGTLPREASPEHLARKLPRRLGGDVPTGCARALVLY